MALTDENGIGATMLVSPTGGMVNGNGGFGFGGDSWAWIILLLLLGWGNNGNGFGGGYGGNSDFPWLMTGQQNINANTNNGFRDAMINDGINGIRDGYSERRGRGRYAKRDSMGRYSSDRYSRDRYSRDGYSNDGYSMEGDFKSDLEDLMEDAPNDQVRQKLQAIMNEVK